MLIQYPLLVFRILLLLFLLTTAILLFLLLFLLLQQQPGTRYSCVLLHLLLLRPLPLPTPPATSFVSTSAPFKNTFVFLPFSPPSTSIYRTRSPAPFLKIHSTVYTLESRALDSPLSYQYFLLSTSYQVSILFVLVFCFFRFTKKRPRKRPRAPTGLDRSRFRVCARPRTDGQNFRIDPPLYIFSCGLVYIEQASLA